MNEQEFNSLPLAQRKAAQQRLIDAGLYSGSPDGKWGPGTANAFKAEEKRRVEDAERARKGGLEEKKVEAEAAKTKAEAAAAQAKAEEEERKTKARKARSDQAATPQGIATQIGANVLAPMAGTAAGMGMGKVTNFAMDKAQESRNKVLRGVASDRLAGRTTTAGAREGARLSGSVPMASPALRTTARMLPHMGLGALSIGKGAQILSEEDPEGPFYPEMANRAAGLGYIGAGAGLAKQGLRYGAAPGVAPDAQALAIINSNQLRRNGIGGAPTLESAEAMPRGPLKTIDAEVIPDEPQQKALPAPKEPEGKRKHSERLISAARSGGATGIKSKSAAATWIAANLGDENRAAIARELGVKPGPKFQQRVLTAVKNMAKKPGASALVPAIAAGTAFLASPERAEASRDGGDFTGRDEALTNAGIAGGLAYGTGKAIESLPRVAGRAAGAGLSALVPSMAADAYDPTQEELNRDRNIAARYLPSFLRAGGVEEAYQMAQVPERSPVNAGPRLANPANPDAAIDEALGIVRRANGGRVSGGFHFDTGGRTDNIPLDVVPGTYIIPADVVSALGQGNTMAGIKVLDNMFPPQAEVKQPKAAGGRADPNGGRVPIIVAGGEFKVDPYHVAALGEGDVQAGADMLDEWVQSVRQQHIDTLKSLPGPAESATEEGRNRAPFEQGGHARSVSEDEVQFGYNPIDELRQSINTSVFTPEQAAENRRRTLMEALSVIPGPGNVISAQDAYTGTGDAYDAFQRGDYKGGALASALAGLSGAGAVLGLPFGKFAKGAADAAHDSLYAIPAWHGSPHDFDEFKLDKIGTGEGAQAYGHGLYFAENPAVAKDYQKNLSAATMTIDGQPFTPKNYSINQIIGDNLGDTQAMKVSLQKYIGENSSNPYADVDDAKALIASIDQGKFNTGTTGRLYRTELDVEPEDLLDWDKPLSQQSEKVRAALAQAGLRYDESMTGAQIYAANRKARTSIGGSKTDPALQYPIEWMDETAASQALREAGIPGIRYLDQGSRGAGEGSRNFVIFDDSLVKILGKE